MQRLHGKNWSRWGIKEFAMQIIVRHSQEDTRFIHFSSSLFYSRWTLIYGLGKKKLSRQIIKGASEINVNVTVQANSRWVGYWNCCCSTWIFVEEWNDEINRGRNENRLILSHRWCLNYSSQGQGTVRILSVGEDWTCAKQYVTVRLLIFAGLCEIFNRGNPRLSPYKTK